MKIFSIFDSKASAFLRPFTLPSAAHAIREIAEIMQQPGPFSDYPEDFTLFEIGEFTEQTGELQPMLAHQSHGNLLRIGNELRNRRQKAAQPETAAN